MVAILLYELVLNFILRVVLYAGKEERKLLSFYAPLESCQHVAKNAIEGK